MLLCVVAWCVFVEVDVVAVAYCVLWNVRGRLVIVVVECCVWFVVVIVVGCFCWLWCGVGRARV